jgi:hypothetical protein
MSGVAKVEFAWLIFNLHLLFFYLFFNTFVYY